MLVHRKFQLNGEFKRSTMFVLGAIIRAFGLSGLTKKSERLGNSVNDASISSKLALKIFA